MENKVKEKEPKQEGEHKKEFGLISILQDIVDFKGWELIFKLLIFTFIGWAIYSLYIVYLFHHDPAFASIPKFSIYDFKMAAIPTLIFFGYKHLCLKLFYGWTKARLDHKKYNEEEKHIRATRGAVWVSNVIYYSFSSLLAYFLFKDTFFYPKLMGGSAECPDIYKYSPFVPEFPYGTLFYQVQFGWHFHTLIDHVVYKWRDAKFWEMFLHHGVAVFLIFFSYLSNQVPVGILVLATHDPSDIGLCASRYYNDLYYKKRWVLAVIFGFFTLSWIYLRLFTFPKCIVGTGFIALWNYPKDLMYPVYLFMMFMMGALIILHLFWFTWVLRILLGLCSKNGNYNPYDKKKDVKAQ